MALERPLSQLEPAVNVADGLFRQEWYSWLDRLIDSVNKAIEEGGTGDLEARVTALEAAVAAIEGDITSIEGDITTIEGSITTINAAIAALDARIDALEALSRHVFDTIALAEAYAPPGGVFPTAVEVLSKTVLGDGTDAWYRKIASPPLPNHDLKFTMNGTQLYERFYATAASPVNLVELGAIPNDTTKDFSLILNKAITASENSGFKYWYLPPGNFYCLTRPNDINFSGFVLLMGGEEITFLRKRFLSNGTIDAVLNVRKNGFKVSDGTIISDLQSQHPTNFVGQGSLISVVAVGENIGYCSFERLTLTGDVAALAFPGTPGSGPGATTLYPLVIDGTGASGGVRIIKFLEVKFFGGENGCIACTNGNPQMQSCETIIAGGKAAHTYFTGIGTPLQHMRLDMNSLAGKLVMANCTRCYISSPVFGDAFDFDANTTNILTQGTRFAGGIVDNGSLNRHIDTNPGNNHQS